MPQAPDGQIKIAQRVSAGDVKEIDKEVDKEFDLGGRARLQSCHYALKDVAL